MNNFISTTLLLSFLITISYRNKQILISEGISEFNKITNNRRFLLNLFTSSFAFQILKSIFAKYTLFCITLTTTSFIFYNKVKEKSIKKLDEKKLKIMIKDLDVKNAILYFMESKKDFPKLELKYNSKTNREERISIIKSLHKKNSLKQVTYENMPIDIIKERIFSNNKRPNTTTVEEKPIEEENIWIEIIRTKYNKTKLQNFIHKCMDLYEKEVKINNTTVNQVQFFRWKFSNNRKDWTWVEENPIQKRSLDTLIGKQHEKVIKDIEQFEKDSQFYVDYGIPYKRSYILHGPPGTGKTTLIRVVATKFGKTIFNLDINLPGLTDEALVSAVSKLPLNAMIILEDIGSDIGKKFQNSTLLNVLDGVCASYGNLIFMTTNNLKSFQQNVNPAFFRPGRIDQIFSISYSTKEEIEDYFIRFYSKADLPKHKVTQLSELAHAFSAKLESNNTITVADLQRVCIEFRLEPEKAVENVNKIINTYRFKDSNNERKAKISLDQEINTDEDIIKKIENNNNSF